MIRPMAIQDSDRPVAKMAPGRPISIQPLMSDAPADSEATAGFSWRPPSMYPDTSSVDLR